MKRFNDPALDAAAHADYLDEKDRLQEKAEREKREAFMANFDHAAEQADPEMLVDGNDMGLILSEALDEAESLHMLDVLLLRAARGDDVKNLAQSILSLARSTYELSL